MKHNFSLVLPILLFAELASSQSVTFPEVHSWKKNPHIKFENKATAILKKNGQLKNSFEVITGLEDELTLIISTGELITVLKNTKVTVPQISPDTGEISEIILQEGQVRYVSPEGLSDKNNEKTKKTRFKSDFFDLTMPPGVDVLVTFNRSLPTSLPTVKFQVIKGEMTAEFLDFEKKQILQAGEEVVFTGIIEKNEIKYDYLLDGRKSPHGVLSNVKKFDLAEYEQEKKRLEELEKNAAKKKQHEQNLKKKKKQAFENSFLCHKPYGHRDNCYWKKVESKCFRFRCNVNGKWGDSTERPVDEKCQDKPAALLFVQKCDY